MSTIRLNHPWTRFLSLILLFSKVNSQLSTLSKIVRINEGSLSGNWGKFSEVRFHTYWWYTLIVLQHLNHVIVYADSVVAFEPCTGIR